MDTPQAIAMYMESKYIPSLPDGEQFKFHKQPRELPESWVEAWLELMSSRQQKFLAGETQEPVFRFSHVQDTKKRLVAAKYDAGYMKDWADKADRYVTSDGLRRIPKTRGRRGISAEEIHDEEEEEEAETDQPQILIDQGGENLLFGDDDEEEVQDGEDDEDDEDDDELPGSALPPPAAPAAEQRNIGSSVSQLNNLATDATDPATPSTNFDDILDPALRDEPMAHQPSDDDVEMDIEPNTNALVTPIASPSGKKGIHSSRSSGGINRFVPPPTGSSLFPSSQPAEEDTDFFLSLLHNLNAAPDSAPPSPIDQAPSWAGTSAGRRIAYLKALSTNEHYGQLLDWFEVSQFCDLITRSLHANILPIA